MLKNGYDQNQPATIAKIDNKKWVLDGQGRIAAAKNAGIPFYKNVI
jgi:ParB-like chromosome segregation protein Spo0J